jgi:hypothetical protein
MTTETTTTTTTTITTTGTAHEDLCTFMIISSRSVLLIMKNVSDKRYRENQNTCFIFDNYFRKSCLLWHNVKKYSSAGHATDYNTLRRTRFSCRITKVQAKFALEEATKAQKESTGIALRFL